jgi:tetratricopeptide (TPR) repeat protein
VTVRRPLGYALFLTLLLAACAAFAGTKPAPRSAAEEAATYEHCMELAETKPLEAQYFAKSWKRAGGAHPAEHCAAVALFRLGKYREAAQRLGALARAMAKDPPDLRAHILDQAGEAWLAAGDPGRAYADLGEALTLLPNDPDILVDRAQAEALSGHFERAVTDLDSVLERDPTRVDALVYRASAYRALGRLGPALADADKAVGLAPGSAPALLERGNIRLLQGDLAGARADWLEIEKLEPKSAAALAAAANLARLEEGRPPSATGPKHPR